MLSLDLSDMRFNLRKLRAHLIAQTLNGLKAVKPCEKCARQDCVKKKVPVSNGTRKVYMTDCYRYHEWKRNKAIDEGFAGTNIFKGLLRGIGVFNVSLKDIKNLGPDKIRMAAVGFHQPRRRKTK